MKLRPRRRVSKLGPLRVTSVTMHFGPLLTLELWKRST